MFQCLGSIIFELESAWHHSIDEVLIPSFQDGKLKKNALVARRFNFVVYVVYLKQKKKKKTENWTHIHRTTRKK